MASAKFEEFRLSLAEREQRTFMMKDESREEFLRRVFGQAWVFTHYNSEFHYVPAKEAHPTAVLGRIGRQFAAEENLAPEQSLEVVQHEGWKAAVVVTDPRHHTDGQKVLMNSDPLVGKPFSLLSTLIRHINVMEAEEASYVITIEPIFDPNSFWVFAAENQGDITSLAFEFATPNMFGGTESLETELRNLRDDERAQFVSISLKSQDGLNTNTDSVRQGVEYAEKGAGAVRARTRKGKTYSSKRRAKSVTLDKKDEAVGTLFDRVMRQIKALIPK